MVLFNHSTRELTAKIVFYGPGLCGKTTNLKILHERLDKQSVGKLLSLSTAQDRTIYFDLLPVELGNIKGYTVRFQLCTVPGQVFYNETRKLVLKGVDGIVFVVDSQHPSLPHNRESFQNLKDNLAELDRPFEQIPIVIQYNKRDLAGALSIEQMQESLGFRDYSFVEAIANQGHGVVETFRLISKLTFTDLMRRLQKPGGMDIAADLLFDKPKVPVPRTEPETSTVRVTGLSERLTPPPVPALGTTPKPQKRDDAWLQLLGREEKKPSPPTNSGRDLLGMAVAASSKLEPPKHPPKTVDNPFDISSSWPMQAGTDVFSPGRTPPRPPVAPAPPSVPPRQPLFFTRPAQAPVGPPPSGVVTPTYVPPPPPPLAPPVPVREAVPPPVPLDPPAAWTSQPPSQATQAVVNPPSFAVPEGPPVAPPWLSPAPPPIAPPAPVFPSPEAFAPFEPAAAPLEPPQAPASAVFPAPEAFAPFEPASLAAPEVPPAPPQAAEGLASTGTPAETPAPALAGEISSPFEISSPAPLEAPPPLEVSSPFAETPAEFRTIQVPVVPPEIVARALGSVAPVAEPVSEEVPAESAGPPQVHGAEGPVAKAEPSVAEEASAGEPLEIISGPVFTPTPAPDFEEREAITQQITIPPVGAPVPADLELLPPVDAPEAPAAPEQPAAIASSSELALLSRRLEELAAQIADLSSGTRLAPLSDKLHSLTATVEEGQRDRIQGFESVTSRLDSFGSSLEIAQKGFATQMDSIAAQLVSLAPKDAIEGLSARLEESHGRIAAIERALNPGETVEKVSELEARLAAIETSLAEVTGRVASDSAERSDEQSRRLAAIETSLTEITGRVASDSAERFEEQSRRLAAIEASLAETTARLTSESVERSEEHSRRLASLASSLGQLRDSLTERLEAEAQQLRLGLDGLSASRDSERSQILASLGALTEEKLAAAPFAAVQHVEDVRGEISTLAGKLESVTAAMAAPSEELHKVRETVLALADELAAVRLAVARESEERALLEKRLDEAVETRTAAIRAAAEEEARGLRQRIDELSAALAAETSARAAETSRLEESLGKRFEALEQASAEYLTLESVSALLETKLATVRSELEAQLTGALKGHEEALERARAESKTVLEKASATEGRSRQLLSSLKKALAEFEEVSSSAETGSGDPPASPDAP